ETMETRSPQSVYEALEKIGLQGREDLPVRQLSAGQQRRVALARLHLSQAKVWLLDEPFTAIDKKGVDDLVTLFKQHCSNGGIILFTSHQSISDTSIKSIMLTGSDF
ncbi:MAG: ATP-binding cassette domain-containing protein, partial [Saezia sp.]